MIMVKMMVVVRRMMVMIVVVVMKIMRMMMPHLYVVLLWNCFGIVIPPDHACCVLCVYV